MRILMCSLSVILALLICEPVQAKKCLGSDPCTACTTCGYCKHCAVRGGSCGVCKNGHGKDSYQHFKKSTTNVKIDRTGSPTN